MKALFPPRQTLDLISIRDRLAVRFGKIRVEERSDPAGLNFGLLCVHACVVAKQMMRLPRQFGFVGVRADTKAAYNVVVATVDGLDTDDLFEYIGK